MSTTEPQNLESPRDPVDWARGFVRTYGGQRDKWGFVADRVAELLAVKVGPASPVRPQESDGELLAQLKDFETYLGEEMALPAFRIAQSYLAGIHNMLRSPVRDPAPPLCVGGQACDGAHRCIDPEHCDDVVMRGVRDPSPPEIGWLIEIGQAQGHSPNCWWRGGLQGADERWTTDANDAVRFARREDAERVIGYVIPGAKIPSDVAVVEHAWLGVRGAGVVPPEAHP